MLTHSLEQLARSIAEHHAQSPCTKNYGRDSACVKGLDTPLTEKLRTVQECYDCIRSWMEEWERQQQ